MQPHIGYVFWECLLVERTLRMFIYLFVGLLFGGLAIAHPYVTLKNGNKYAKPYFYCILIFTIFLIVAFRKCGFDYDNYLYWFNSLQSDYWKNNAVTMGIEIGYAWINNVVGSYRTLLIIIAALTMGIYSTFIYKKSPYPFLSLYLLLGTFLYPTLMGQYRQGAAIAFFLLALLYRKNQILFCTIIVCGSFLHVSILLTLVTLFVPDKLLTKKQYLAIIIIALLCNVGSYDIFLSMIDSMPDFVAAKLNVYQKTEQGTILRFNLAMLLRIIIFLIFYKERYCISQYKDGIFYLNLYFVSLFIYLGFGFLPQLAGRGSIYFYFMELILSAMIMSRERRSSFFYLIFFLSVGMYRQISFFSIWHEDYIPYKSELLSVFGL